MIKYKVNLQFKDIDKSLNEIIIQALKTTLQKNIDMTCKNYPAISSHTFKSKESLINDWE